jgi:hypothetical protein
MDMQTHENSVSIQYNFHVETKLVLFIILCTLFITSCFIQSNISAQSSVVNNNLFGNSTQQSTSQQAQPFLGINMRGYYTSMPQLREEFKSPFPSNYYESSFETISKTHAIDHLRYRFYWESYVRNSTAFMNEIEQVANAADKHGIKIVYDNHQFHTSSWLNVGRGTGFPVYLFNNSLLYEQDSGGAPKSEAAKTWWNNWWNNAIEVNGTDGWTLQLDFLKKIVSTVDKHPSTLGYEILSEPQVHKVDQWSKIGNYNTFITKELRKITDKTIIYSMNIPIDLKSEIKVNAENLAKMSPQNKENVVFKFSLYGIPSDGYQKDKLQLFENASRIAGVPLYIGEWNNIKRVQTYNEKGDKVWEIDSTQSDMSQAEANTIVETFKHIGIWGLAFWEWSFMPNDTPNFNLVNVTYNNATREGNIQPTKYYEIVKNAYEQLYGQPSERVFPTASRLTAP